jgi:RNA polymerase subunit RPABC4/transcription elongation factor Spt4
MRTCAKCGREYRDSYDACPHCAQREAKVTTYAVVGAVVLVVVCWPWLMRLDAALFGH